MAYSDRTGVLFSSVLFSFQKYLRSINRSIKAEAAVEDTTGVVVMVLSSTYRKVCVVVQKQMQPHDTAKEASDISRRSVCTCLLVCVFVPLLCNVFACAI